jgi:hypothetical protein
MNIELAVNIVTTIAGLVAVTAALWSIASYRRTRQMYYDEFVRRHKKSISKGVESDKDPPARP